jgi:hypothetical protein
MSGVDADRRCNQVVGGRIFKPATKLSAQSKITPGDSLIITPAPRRYVATLAKPLR